MWHFLLLTGDTECGKTTLIAKLQATEEPKKGTDCFGSFKPNYHTITITMAPLGSGL